MTAHRAREQLTTTWPGAILIGDRRTHVTPKGWFRTVWLTAVDDGLQQ